MTQNNKKLHIGVDIGGTDTKIGLVDTSYRLLAAHVMPTGASRQASEIVADIGKNIGVLLEKQRLSLQACSFVGVGVPGTVERESGIVRYSNNLRWEDVRLAQALADITALPVKIANDADCAALGETLAGAGRGYENVVMITLGTGVGGGIILNGKLFTGSCTGGSEPGHMVIIEGGERCTCGRRGCLEAYASATALKRDAGRASGMDMAPKEIFDAAAGGDARMQEVVAQYIRRLGTGIANIVNVFRPQLVLLGGGISAQGEVLLAPLREMLAEECFGGRKNELPRLKIAALGNQAGMLGAAGLKDFSESQ